MSGMLKSFLSTFLLLFVTSLSAVVAAEPEQTCDHLLSSPSSAEKFVYQYRMEHLYPLNSERDAAEPGFHILGKLGQSTSVVFLANDLRDGSSVVIKRSTRRMPIALSMLWRELVVTEYLLAIGEKVPQILKVEVTEEGAVLLIKEYFTGLTGMELKNERSFWKERLPEELAETAWNTLEIEQERLRSLFLNGSHECLSFQKWYDANHFLMVEKYPKVWDTVERLSQFDPELKTKLKAGYSQDFGIQNLLYDLGLKKWLPYDP